MLPTSTTPSTSNRRRHVSGTPSSRSAGGGPSFPRTEEHARGGLRGAARDPARLLRAAAPAADAETLDPGRPDRVRRHPGDVRARLAGAAALVVALHAPCGAR